ncbi:MAG: MerR family transcriptional regulator [Clostridia bacterium]|nr:MerR family transcriptional regulator [Clostridia bacterium]
MRQNELFPIGEVSRLFHVSVSILRYYDKIGLVKPEYTDPETGYRFYSARQFECLNTIRYLRALDMPLGEITRFLQNRNIGGIRGMLVKQKEEVVRRQRELAVIQRKIENRLEQIEDALGSELDAVTISKKPARRLACIKKSLAPRSYLDLEYSIRELERPEKSAVTFLGKVGVGLSVEALSARRFTPYDLVFIILDEVDSFAGRTVQLPEETCVSVRFRGGHDRAPAYYARLMRYIEEQRYEIAGFSKEITMIDDGLTDDESEFVTEIQIPVAGV